jgi:hypothetical protein
MSYADLNLLHSFTFTNKFLFSENMAGTFFVVPEALYS